MGSRIRSPSRILSSQPTDITLSIRGLSTLISISASSRSIPTLTSPGRRRSRQPWQSCRLSSPMTRVNRKSRIDGTSLEKPIELPKKGEKPKGKKGTKVPLNNDAPTTHMVAAAEAAADNTMYCDCVITTHASNCRVVKVLFDTGSTSFSNINFVGLADISSS